MTTLERTTIQDFLKKNHNSEIKYVLELVPVSAPRMTKSDQWKTNPNHPNANQRQRKCVTQYFAYKNALQLMLKKINYKLPIILKVVFVVPMPESWSRKKKEALQATFHQSKPDIDNLTKAFMDSYGINDSIVSGLNVYKVWGYEGAIILF